MISKLSVHKITSDSKDEQTNIWKWKIKKKQFVCIFNFIEPYEIIPGTAVWMRAEFVWWKRKQKLFPKTNENVCISQMRHMKLETSFFSTLISIYLCRMGNCLASDAIWDANAKSCFNQYLQNFINRHSFQRHQKTATSSRTHTSPNMSCEWAFGHVELFCAKFSIQWIEIVSHSHGVLFNIFLNQNEVSIFSIADKLTDRFEIHRTSDYRPWNMWNEVEGGYHFWVLTVSKKKITEFYKFFDCITSKDIGTYLDSKTHKRPIQHRFVTKPTKLQSGEPSMKVQ